MIQSTIKRYLDRYQDIKNKLGLHNATTEQITELISNQKSDLNNYFMAALGLSTLLLRLGAVVSLCKKLHHLDDKGDALFMKQVIDNLRETLPSDTSWRTIWEISATNDSHWSKPLVKDSNGQNILGRFVKFRNNFVHQSVRIIPEHITSIQKSMVLFDEMATLAELFENTSISLEENKLYFNTPTEKYCLHPFLQNGEEEGLPYLFQGLYGNKTEAKFINTHFGNEWPDTKENEGLEKSRQIATASLEPTFEPMRQALRGGAGQVFDHSERIAYYQECFVGRDEELEKILDWCQSDSKNNVLPIYAEAGMGKGALVAEVIEQLKLKKSKEDKFVPVLYHFCRSGMQNSLHATLYHLILQGKKNQWWDTTDEQVAKKLERLPSKYIDLIHFFQLLLSANFKSPRNNKSGNLIIIIDALDEAAVANSSMRLSDWFYTYNEKEEPKEDWRSPSNIKWIFTYRSSAEGEKQFYQLHNFKEIESIEMLQPLKGLGENAVEKALEKFNVSKGFIAAVIEKGKIE
jgi:hypothetical protein